jgi:hypothetical protein
LAFRIAGARRIALRRDRAPLSLSKGRRATPPPAAACQRSRFTCPNSRGRHAYERGGRRTQSVMLGDLAQNKNNFKVHLYVSIVPTRRRAPGTRETR